MEASKNYFRAGFISASMPSFSGPHSWLDTLRLSREDKITQTNKLYHYTSLSGFKGIIDSNGFWASDNRFLNDAEEVIHGRNLANSVLNYKIKQVGASPFCSVLEKAADAMREKPRTGRLIVCFSKARDSLEQWRGYGDDSGICIQFGGAQVANDKAEIAPLFFGPDQLPLDIQYSNRSKIVSLLSVIRRFSNEYSKDRNAMANRWPEDHDEEYCKHLLNCLESTVVTFKNESFAEEKEVRLAIPYEFSDHYESGLQHRVSKFGLIPYICTGDRKGLDGILPITEIIIGPSQNSDLIRISIDAFMKNKGYADIPITLSKVPFRN